MTNVRLVFSVFLLCTGVFPARAQISFSSLQQVLDYADNHAISIQSAKDQQQIATSKYRTSKAALLPSLSASAGFNDNITLQPTLVPANLFNPAAPAGTFNEYTFGRKYVYSTGVQAGWDVVNFQKWFDVKTADAARKLSEASIVNTRFQLYNQLAQTYYSILLTGKYIGIANGNIAAADSIYRIANDKYEAGIFTEENLNRSKIQLAQAQQQASDLTSSLAQLYNQLQTQLNTNEQLMLTDTLSAAYADKADEAAITSVHPQVQVQEAQLKLNEQQLAQNRSMLYPTLGLGYQYNQNWASDKMFDLSGANHLPQQFFAAKLNIPLFNGLATRGKISQSRIQLRQQQQVLENQRLAAQKEDENLDLQYHQSIVDMNKQEEILALQSSNDNHSKDRYESGIIGLDERLDKFTDLLQVQNQYMQSLSNYYINYYKRYIRIKR
ncbi:MAG TPA: TolC family protein [Flavipsychrobacter sp.]|nr:TolC family protein [Flavipsychrobacter sp.]